MTRVEVQGGGITEVPALTPEASFIIDKFGLSADTQMNGSRALAVTNSNFADFLQEDILTHPGFLSQILTVNPNGLAIGLVTRATTFQGEPTDLLTINDTFSNTPVGVAIIGEQAGNDVVQQEDVTEYVALNNTFYNDPTAVTLTSVAFNGLNQNSHIHFTAMDNIFANGALAVAATGQTQREPGAVQPLLQHHHGQPHHPGRRRHDRQHPADDPRPGAARDRDRRQRPTSSTRPPSTST